MWIRHLLGLGIGLLSKAYGEATHAKHAEWGNHVMKGGTFSGLSFVHDQDRICRVISINEQVTTILPLMAEMSR